MGDARRRPEEVYARMMEIYAAYLEQTDHNVGRVIDAIERDRAARQHAGDLHRRRQRRQRRGQHAGPAQRDDLLQRCARRSQAGARSRGRIGTWKTYNHYPVGWAHAMCTPFQWTKQVASHFGGTRNGMVISWPGRIKDKGGLRASSTT